MISFLMSRCRSLIFGELLDEIVVQKIVEPARSLWRRAERGEGLWIYIGPHAKTEVHAALGDAIPGFGLGQGSGADLDGDGGEDFRTAQGDGRCAPMKGRRMAWLGARPFREYDQALAVLQGIAGGVEHVHAAIVADVLLSLIHI